MGSLDSFRNIIHASDVANAIHTIISQDNGDTYLICNDESHKILDVVLKLYSLSEIELEKRENVLYEKNTGLEVLAIENDKMGLDSTIVNIRGKATKLKKLGWNPVVSIEQILNL